MELTDEEIFKVMRFLPSLETERSLSDFDVTIENVRYTAPTGGLSMYGIWSELLRELRRRGYSIGHHWNEHKEPNNLSHYIRKLFR